MADPDRLPEPENANTATEKRQTGTDGAHSYFEPRVAEHAGGNPPRGTTENTPHGTAAIEEPPTHPADRDARALVVSRHPSAIRLRRLRAPTLAPQLDPTRETYQEPTRGRRRSRSDPQRPGFASATTWPALSPVGEASQHQSRGQEVIPTAESAQARVPGGDAARWHHHLPGRRRLAAQGPPPGQEQDSDYYDSKIVDFLDVVDPEVATLSSITNIQNSLFVPSLGKWVDRRPTYDLSELPPMPGAFPPPKDEVAAAEQDDSESEQSSEGTRSPSFSSVLSDRQYAILPDGASLQGWSEEDIKALNDYVRHMLRSRRSKIKQRLKAFGKYVKKPLGFLVTLYATLITLFGLAWVLFLIGWIYVGDRQLFAINVIDNVLVALFAIVGVGFAPFRAIDTYHMIFVVHYHRKTWKLRKKLRLPELRDHNDLPTGNDQGEADQDTEAQPRQDDQEFSVLSEKEQARLVHHQNKLAKSHTFYKPHETETHDAFPLRLLIAIVLLLDLHSCLQTSLGAVTWGIHYEVRPAAVTTTLLCCSIASNVAAGVLISIGDRRTRKKDVLDRLEKQELTGKVMKKMRKVRKKKEKEAQQDDANQESQGNGGAKSRRSSLSAALKSIPGRTRRNRKSEESEESEGREGSEGSGRGKKQTAIHPTGDHGDEKHQPDEAQLRLPGTLPPPEGGA